MNTKTSKPTRDEIRIAKMILRGWGTHKGKVTKMGLHAIGQALRILKQAYGEAA